MAKKTLPELIQEQINASSIRLGKVKEDNPRGYFTNVADPTIYGSSDNITWSARTFSALQGRCANYSPTTSGFNRGVYSGWCVASLGDDISDPTVAAGKFNWLRTGGCSLGQFATCSGYQYTPYYTPHWKDFRSTTQDVLRKKVVSPDGTLIESVLPSGYNSIYSIDIYRENPGSVTMNMSTPNSIALFVSGHLKYTSNVGPNSSNQTSFYMPGREWVRLDITHYNPFPNGRLALGTNFADFIDAWREPPVPSGINAYYSTFTRQDTGSIIKRSYIMGTFTTESDDTITGIDVEWRAPNLLPQWRRILLPVSYGNAGVQISGIWSVPHSEEIEIRARAVNQWSDPGVWHTVSGIYSSLGNVKPAQSPEPSIRAFSMIEGVTQFEFSVTPSTDEQWRDFILVSGGANDDYADTGLTSSSANVGDDRITSSTTPTYVNSGMLISINGGYSSDTNGELHIVKDIQNGGLDIVFEEPLVNSISSPVTWKAYHTVLKSAQTKFSLPIYNKATWYFNVVGRNFNGGISPFAKDSSSWLSGNMHLVVSGRLFEDEGANSGNNYLRNGSLEYPRYDSTLTGTYGTGAYVGGIPGIQDPFDLTDWYMVSGWGPYVSHEVVRSGRQCVTFVEADPAKPELSFGHHAGIWQDVEGLAWGGTYYFKSFVSRNPTTSRLPYKLSGVIGLYHEIWEVNRGQIAGVDYPYGSLPAGAAFISSGIVEQQFDASASVFNEDENFIEQIKQKFTVTGSSDGFQKAPIVRFCVFLPNSNYNEHTSSSSTPAWGAFQEFAIDDVTVSRADRKDSPFDSHVAPSRWDFTATRLNQDAYTDIGDNLLIDTTYGLNITRRDENPGGTNRQAYSSIANATILGHLNIEKTVMHFPSESNSWGGFTGSNHSSTGLVSNGAITIPSGKAFYFDIRPTRTFISGTDTEILDPSGNPVGYFVPSGGSKFGSTYYDPGIHSLAQVLDVYYIRSDLYSSTVSKDPLVAFEGDITLAALWLKAYTAFYEPSSDSQPGTEHAAYWHVCSITVKEIEEPFVASGISAAGDTIGAATQDGYISLPTPYGGAAYRSL